MSLRVGIVGLGDVGGIHLLAYVGSESFSVVAGVELNPERLADMAGNYGFTPYSDYREMLANEQLDIVCVTTPALVHEEVVLAAAEAGCHVLCEKPITLTLESADRMIAACEQAGVKFQYGSTYRYLSPVLKAREIIANGEIGDVILIRENYVTGTGPENFKHMGFHHYPEGGPGGSGMGMVDHGIHMIDVFPWLAGDEIVSIAGRALVSGEAPITEYAVMHMSRGATGIVVLNDHTWSTILPNEGAFTWGGAWNRTGYVQPGAWDEEPNAIHVHGTKGALKIGHYSHRLYKNSAAGPEQIKLDQEISPIHFRRQMESFVESIVNGTEVAVTGQDGRKALAWLLKIYQQQA